MRMVLLHVFDLREYSFLDRIDSATTHTPRDIDAVYNRYVLWSVLCPANLLLFLLVFNLHLWCRLQYVADGRCLRFFFGVHLDEVFVIAKLTCPELFALLFGELTEHIKYALA